MRYRQERIDGVQFPSLVFGVVHAVDSQAHFEAKTRLVSQHPGEVDDVLGENEEGDFVAVDHDLVDDG